MENNNPEKYQVQHCVKKNVVPCDKLSNHMFGYSSDEYAEILRYHEQCDCVEGIKKGKKIITPYWLELIEGYVDLSPLNAFHREVLFSAISAYEQGIRIITISTTLHSLTGGNQTRVRNNQYAAIRGAFEKLGFTRIEIDLAPLFEAFPNYATNFKGNRDRARIVGILLPMKYLEAEINGQKVLAIELLGESPLMSVAKLKKQLLTYDISPLAISGQNNTPQVITVKNYLLRRINQIERGLNSSILFDTLYMNCGLADATKRQKQDARKIIADILNALKRSKVIEKFEFKKQGRIYHSIKILTNKSENP